MISHEKWFSFTTIIAQENIQKVKKKNKLITGAQLVRIIPKRLDIQPREEFSLC